MFKVSRGQRILFCDHAYLFRTGVTVTTQRGEGVGSTGPETPLVIAHRGASAIQPENTLPAFAAAATFRADWVEFDVHRTADNRLAVHHDDTLADGRLIAGLTEGELPESVPTLAEVLALCAAHGLGVNVEIKSDPRRAHFDPDYRVVVTVLEDLARWSGPLLVTSFDRACLARVRVLAPDVPTGRLASNILDVAKLIEQTADAGHVALNPWDPFINEDLMALARAAGLRVYPWTVDDPARQRELIDLGVDGIITNRPDVLRAVLDDA